jgi:acyl-homoserine lactone synthase
MIHIVTSENANQYKDQLEDMFRWRHRIYVEQRGWTAIARPDGREIDQFDNEDAVYLLALNESGRFEGSVRLIPTNKPNLFSEVFPQFISRGAVPNSPMIWELTRWFTLPNTRKESGRNQTAETLLTAMMEWGVMEGIESLICLTEVKRLPRVLSLGWVVDPLGLPVMLEGEYWVAVQFEVGARLLEITKQSFLLPDTTIFANRPSLNLAS